MRVPHFMGVEQGHGRPALRVARFMDVDVGGAARQGLVQVCFHVEYRFVASTYRRDPQQGVSLQ